MKNVKLKRRCEYPSRHKKVTIRWQHVTIQWQHVTVRWQSVQKKNNTRLSTHVLKTMMTQICPVAEYIHLSAKYTHPGTSRCIKQIEILTMLIPQVGSPIGQIRDISQILFR